MATSRRSSSWRYPAAIGVVAVSALAAEILYRITGSNRLSVVFLAGVLVVAYWLGSGPAYLAAGVAFFVYNFYLVEPRFTFSLEPEAIITLAVFLAVAMLTGNLTGRVRDQAARAQARARTTASLFDATREFSASSEELFIRERLAHHLARAARGEAVVRDGEQVVSAPNEDSATREILAETQPLDHAHAPLASATAEAGGWTMRPLRADEGAFGVAAWRTLEPEPLTADEQTLLDILADVGAAAIARARLAAGKAEAEARAKTEDLRNSLLSSISHDLRTPLAAILASASSLHEFGETFAPDVRADLAATIQEEAVRLDAFVANLLNMTRLQSGAVAIRKVPFNIPEIVQATVERRTRASRRQVTVSLEPSLPEGLGDPVLFEQALGNVVENAIRYTAPGAAIVVSATRGEGGLAVQVRDEGPGVPPEDLDRIFQKFYRSSSAGDKPGTGLGLSIARGLIEGMGGSVEAANRTDAPTGLMVKLTVPVAVT